MAGASSSSLGPPVTSYRVRPPISRGYRTQLALGILDAEKTIFCSVALCESSGRQRPVQCPRTDASHLACRQLVDSGVMAPQDQSPSPRNPLPSLARIKLWFLGPRDFPAAVVTLPEHVVSDLPDPSPAPAPSTRRSPLSTWCIRFGGWDPAAWTRIWFVESRSGCLACRRPVRRRPAGRDESLAESRPSPRQLSCHAAGLRPPAGETGAGTRRPSALKGFR